jgi:hypothetical protein
MSHFQTALVAEAVMVDGGYTLHWCIIATFWAVQSLCLRGIALIWRVSPEYSGG